MEFLGRLSDGLIGLLRSTTKEILKFGIVSYEGLATGVGTAGQGLQRLYDEARQELTSSETTITSGQWQGSVQVDVPVTAAFAFWMGYENIPRCISHVRDVHDLGEGRSEWRVVGHGGIILDCHVRQMQCMPPRLLQWTTESTSPVQCTLTISFQPDNESATCLKIDLQYNHLAGALGHGLSDAEGEDAHAMLEHDVQKMKALIEKENGHAKSPELASGGEFRSAS